METPIKAGHIRITIERGGESTITEVPEGYTVGALIKDGHLRGVNVASTRVDGSPATPDTVLNNESCVSEVPKSGKNG